MKVDPSSATFDPTSATFATQWVGKYYIYLFYLFSVNLEVGVAEQNIFLTGVDNLFVMGGI